MKTDLLKLTKEEAINLIGERLCPTRICPVCTRDHSENVQCEYTDLVQRIKFLKENYTVECSPKESHAELYKKIKEQR